MEYTFPELLTRENMLRILQNQRQLKIPESEVTDAELMKIFKSFAMPLAKREKRIAKQRSPLKQTTTSVVMDVDEEMELDMPIKMAFIDFLLENKAISTTEKRHLDIEDDDSLSSATKRIKLAWP